MLGGQGEVPFVLSILIIHHDDHSSLADGFDGRFYGCEG
jgi:hypothetical protein